MLTVSAFLPGRRVARIAAIGVALSLLMLHGIGLLGALRAVWIVLWLAVAWVVGPGNPPAQQGRIARPAGLESGAVAFLLWLRLLRLLLAAVARPDPPP